MITGKQPYPGFAETMNALRDQVIDSYDFAYNNVPQFNHPKDLFRWFKLRTTYMNDPPGIETIQTMQTMFDNNFHGVPGAGDCDCFTVALLAAMKAQGWHDLRIYLTSRHTDYAQHIYTGIKFKGEEYIMDLTNPFFDQERRYPYVQVLEV